MRKLKTPKIGLYVLACIWPDKSFEDPWAVGYIDKILITQNKTYVTVEKNNRYFNHFWKISEQEGKERLKYEHDQGR